MLTLEFVLTSLPEARLVGPPDDIAIGGVAIDSRRVRPGDMFVALRGESGDGHCYIADAVARGAHIVLAETAEASDSGAVVIVDDTLTALQTLSRAWRDRHPIPLVAVTGSVGKSTTKELIAQVLGSRYATLKSEGNQNNEIGLPLTLLRLDESHQWAVVEMAMYAEGEIATLCAIARPKIGVVTNVGPTHLGRLRSLDAIARAKSELVCSLPADGLAVLNGDDTRVAAMAALTAARSVRYGFSEGNDFRAIDIETRVLSGTAFTLRHGDATVRIEMPLIGWHPIYAALAAAAVAVGSGLTLSDVAVALREAEPLRLVPKTAACGATVLDDTYNASPASTLAALDALASTSGGPGRRIAVLGDMLELGDYEIEGHRVVGRRAAEVAQLLVVVGERGRIVGEAALANGLSDVCFATDNDDAVAHLKPLIRAGDIVLVKGSRGMAMESIVERLLAW